MKLNFLGWFRRVEVAVLKVATAIGRWFVRIYRRVYAYLYPRRASIAKYGGLSIIILYVIGAVVFGIRLYAQQKFNNIDRYASYIYPFPIASAGRSIVFNNELQNKVYWANNFAEKTQSEVPSDLPKQILNEILKDRVAMQEADRLGVRVESSDISATFDSVFQGIGGEEQTASYVKEFYGMSLNELRKEAVPKIAMQKIQDSQFLGVKARIILVKDDKRAQEALDKVKSGTKFEDVAKDYSEDTSSKDNGGLLADGEFITLDSGIISSLEGPLFSLEPGAVSDIIKTDLGNAILKVEEKRGTIKAKSDDWLTGLMAKQYPVRDLI